MPTNEDYVHKIGRAGRCGNSGVAINNINECNKPIIHDLEIPELFEKLYQSFIKYYRQFLLNFNFQLEINITNIKIAVNLVIKNKFYGKKRQIL